MKITLINPPYLFSGPETVSLPQCLGLRYISAYLKKYGKHEVDIIDGLMQGFSHIKPYSNGCIVGLPLDEIVSRISKDSGLIGVSVPQSALAPVSHELCEKIKQRFPKVLLVLGGVYPSTQPKLALTSKADFVVVGEGEQALLRIADGKPSSDIKGVYSAKDSENASFMPAEQIKDLDSIPFPDTAFKDIEKYFTVSPRKSHRPFTASIITSRGCPFACEFCSIHPIYGRNWRGRSPANVLGEIEYLAEEFGIKHIEFEDDNFTMHKDRAMAILKGIVELNKKGHNLRWRAPNGVRIDTLDDDNAVRLIKESNCEVISLGLEHGDSEMLSIMNKELDLDVAYNVIKRLIKHKINKILLFFIVGYPGETDLRFSRAVQYLKKIAKLGGNVQVNVTIAQPYPGTRLLKRCQKQGYINDENFDNFLVRKDVIYTGKSIQILTEDFDAKKVLARKNKILLCFEKDGLILTFFLKLSFKMCLCKIMSLRAQFILKIQNLRKAISRSRCV